MIWLHDLNNKKTFLQEERNLQQAFFSGELKVKQTRKKSLQEATLSNAS